MSISIVTITYNSSDKILSLLQTIDHQKKIENLEVIIVDNNSPDKKILKRKIEEFHFTDSKFKLKVKYRKSNYGFGMSCNYGASLAKYQNILFLNPDTTLLKNSLSKILSHSRMSKADICGGKCLYTDSNIIHRTVFNKPTMRTMLFEYSNIGKILKISGDFYVNQEGVTKDLVVDGVGGAYLLINKLVFQELKGFDKNIFMYLEDVDICIRAKELGLKVIYCPHSVIKHFGGASSNNIYKINHKAWYDSREYYLLKHFSIIISWPIYLFYKLERNFLQLRQLLTTS